MNADGFLRILTRGQGPTQNVTMRRAGSPDVATRAAVLLFPRTISAFVGEVQEMADAVTVADRDLKAAGWTLPPRHGDMVVYEDGRLTVVQGSPQVYEMEDDRIYQMRCIGGA